MKPYILMATFMLGACSSPKSLSGHVLTGAEVNAVDTCNAWLTTKLMSTIGSIDVAKSSVHSSASAVSIAWQAEARAGKGIVVCTTDPSGLKVTGAEIDGLQVTP